MASLLPSSYLQTLQPHSKVTTDNTATGESRGAGVEAGTAASAKGRTQGSQTARRQTPTGSRPSVALFALQRFLKRGGVCKLAPAVPAPQLSSSRETES